MRMRGESVFLLYLQIECLVDEIAHGVMDRTESTVPVAQMCAVADGKIVVSIHQNTFSDSRYSGAQVFYAGEGSRGLAERLQTAFVQNLDPTSRRLSKQATGVFLMEHIERPGVLVECGFLSNHQEEARLRDPGYQKKLCCVIAASLSAFALDGQTND